MNNSGISFFADSGKLIVEGSSLSRDQKRLPSCKSTVSQT